MLQSEDSCITLAEYLQQLGRHHSPLLHPSTLNRDSGDTPPPLVDPDASDSDDKDDHHDDHLYEALGRTRPSCLWTDVICRKHSSQGDPDIVPSFSVDTSLAEPQVPSFVDDTASMISVTNVSNGSLLTRTDLTQSSIPRRASLRLHEIIDCPRDYDRRPSNSYSECTLLSSSSFELPKLHIQDGHTSPLDVRPPPKSTTYSMQSDTPFVFQHHRATDSTRQSPTLTRFAITPKDGHSSHTLAKMQGQRSPSHSFSPPPEVKQTLPSLKTALSAVTDASGTPWLESASTHQFGAAPGPYGNGIVSPAYSQPSPALLMSPPRNMSVNPCFWRTTSQNSSVSAQSDQASHRVQTSASTPASSVPGLSPTSSALTPQDIATDAEATASEGPADGIGGQATTGGAGYRCSWHGCNATPFQTQYLLNSHTNVHSNQRPHFCPVEGCPRGPGGQGFKRKNEMIR